MTTGPRLPNHIEPMLARIGEPFDADDHVFEVKWDGVRAVSYVESDGLRVHGRKRRDLASRYPELDVLRRLAPGTVLDGELVVLGADGRPDFPAVLRRENSSSRDGEPVTYVVFDVLYRAFEPVLRRPLAERRKILAGLFAENPLPRVVVSEGVVGRGRDLFAAASAQGLEGIVGKRLDAPYRPGERTGAWVKMKPVRAVHCVILGFEPDGPDDFKSLIVASDFDGRLQCVGRVGSGLDQATKVRLRGELFARRSPRPLVETDLEGAWVAPGLFCRVSYLERTANGSLRAPVFLGMVDGDGT